MGFFDSIREVGSRIISRIVAKKDEIMRRVRPWIVDKLRDIASAHQQHQQQQNINNNSRNANNPPFLRVGIPVH